jgi:hypothetical protein
MFAEVDAFLARAHPGAKLITSSPFFIASDAKIHRRLVLGKERAVANELMSGPCWLVTLGPDPRPWLPAIDSIEQRGAYHVIDYGMEQSTVQWIARLRGPVDLEAVRVNAGGMALLISPASERMIEHGPMSFFASSEADLARALAAHPESFRPAHVR